MSAKSRNYRFVYYNVKQRKFTTVEVSEDDATSGRTGTKINIAANTMVAMRNEIIGRDRAFDTQLAKPKDNVAEFMRHADIYNYALTELAGALGAER